MLFELMRIGGPPRYCPELAGVRARFFTYKDCEPKNGPPAWCCPKYLPVIDRLLWLVSYRREMVAGELQEGNGGPGGSCNLTVSGLKV
jgi:hypothetical protein